MRGAEAFDMRRSQSPENIGDSKLRLSKRKGETLLPLHTSVKKLDLKSSRLYIENLI